MKKPNRRESLSISPRLAKIMINLSEIPFETKNEFLLDAFCGIGVILIESLNQEIKIIGIDQDKNAISGAKENLNFFKFPKENYFLFNDDSSKINLNNFKKKIFAMVSEPDFGETLKKIPTKEQAQKMISRFEKIMISVLKNIKNYLSENSKIVFTSPYIRTNDKKRIGINIENFSKKINLKLNENFPIEEFRENQIVGRQILVFEKYNYLIEFSKLKFPNQTELF